MNAWKFATHMAYFRVVCQPADDLAFERIVNTPKRGIGEATLSASFTTTARAQIHSADGCRPRGN